MANSANMSSRYHGSSSTLQLFRGAQSALDTELSKRISTDDLVQDNVAMRLGGTGSQIFDGFEPSLHMDLSHDKQPISRPPKVRQVANN